MRSRLRRKAASSRVRTGSAIAPSLGRQFRPAIWAAGNAPVPGGTPRMRSSRRIVSLATGVNSFTGLRSCLRGLWPAIFRCPAEVLAWRPNSSKPRQANPSKNAWFCLVLFVRIGTYQWVTAIPNKKFLLVPLLASGRLASHGFVSDDPAKIARLQIFTKALFRNFAPADKTEGLAAL